MKSTHENPFATLSELELNCESDSDLISEKEIRAELRFSEDHLDLGNYEISVTILEATLHLSAWGGVFKPGSRLADKSRLESEYTQSIRRKSVARSASGSSASLSANLGEPLAAISANLDKANQEETELEITQQVNNIHVRATSGNRWIIREGDPVPGQTPLDGTYIANEVLCVLKPNDQTNSVSIDAVVVARKKDFSISAEGNQLQREFRERVHRNKFMQAIIAKSLAERSGQSDDAKQNGRIILSRSKLIVDEDVS